MSLFTEEYMTAIIGGGGAGVAAALAASRRAPTLLVTSSLDTMGLSAWGPVIAARQSLDAEVAAPAILGVLLAGAEQLVRVDTATLQRRRKDALEAQEQLVIYQDTVENLEEHSSGWRIKTKWGASFKAKQVVLAVGTFLGGRWLSGEDSGSGGRPGEAGSERLAEAVLKLGVRVQAAHRNASPVLRHQSWLDPYLAGSRGDTELVLVPMRRRGVELYAYMADYRRSPDEEQIRQITGRERLPIIVPGFSVKYLELAAGQLSGRGELLGRPGMSFVGSVGGRCST